MRVSPPPHLQRQVSRVPARALDGELTEGTWLRLLSGAVTSGVFSESMQTANSTFGCPDGQTDRHLITRPQSVLCPQYRPDMGQQP